jgi:hypothetical protein
MQSPGRSYGIAVALGAALLIAACSASPGASPTTAAVSDVVGGAALAGSASGSGGPAAPGRGTGTPTCDGTGPGPKDGTCTGTTGPDPADIASVLEAALQEEYKAEMLYRSVLADYPGAAPFVSIEQAEERHWRRPRASGRRRASRPSRRSRSPARRACRRRSRTRLSTSPTSSARTCLRTCATSSPTCRPPRSRITCQPSSSASSGIRGGTPLSVSWCGDGQGRRLRETARYDRRVRGRRRPPEAA